VEALNIAPALFGSLSGHVDIFPSS